MNYVNLYWRQGGLVAQAVRRSPPTAGVPSSRLGHSMWVSCWTKRGLGRFFSGFLPFSPTTNFIPPFLHTHLIHFISPCDGTSGGRHPCYSQTYNIRASSHLIPRPDLVLDTSWGYFILKTLQWESYFTGYQVITWNCSIIILSTVCIYIYIYSESI